MKYSLYLIFTFILAGCSLSQVVSEDVDKSAALIVARPILEKIFLAEAPITPSDRELYPTVQSLPGKPFNPQKDFSKRIQFSLGSVLVTPGDYVFPVMSYCMKSSGSSPSAHRYTLGKLSGKASHIIQALYAKALFRFNAKDIQVVSWNIQNRVSYGEMSEKSQKIIDSVIPEYRKELEKSSYQSFIDKWNALSETTGIPRFDEVSDSALDSLGDLGNSIREIKNFRTKIKTGNEYDSLRTIISLPGISQKIGTEESTPWSKTAENVYARFITSGHYLEVGKIEIRVEKKSRTPQGATKEFTKIDLVGLIADPGSKNIQPLSFSPLEASAAIPILAVATPEVIVAFLSTLIISEYTDWGAVGKSIEQWGASTQKEIQNLVNKLRQMYSKGFSGNPGAVKGPPDFLPGFRDLKRARGKTPRANGKVRRRWEDSNGNELKKFNLKEVQKIFNQEPTDFMNYCYLITEKEAPYFREKYGRKFHFRKRDYFLETAEY